eukprot:GFYU01013667.1.p1 GENE.GFYU01013667.1~~GFYU01013667.1.p1  ORF type:complete len:218 (-),score=20.76 GFYU01013667.1:162-815(-)
MKKFLVTAFILCLEVTSRIAKAQPLSRVDRSVRLEHFSLSIPGAEVYLNGDRISLEQGAPFFLQLWLVPNRITGVQWWIASVVLKYPDGEVEPMQCSENPTQPVEHPGDVAQVQCELPSDVLGNMRIEVGVEWRGNTKSQGEQGPWTAGNIGTLQQKVRVRWVYDCPPKEDSSTTVDVSSRSDGGSPVTTVSSGDRIGVGWTVVALSVLVAVASLVM